MRSGADYLKSLRDGRQVFVEGERVKDVTAHPAFREAARSVARLYDIAAAPENRELMTFSRPRRVNRCCAPIRFHVPTPTSRRGGCSRRNGRKRASA